MTGPDSPKPNPVNEWLGLMSGAVEEVRTVLARVPGEMVRLPLVALSAALELRERLRHEDRPSSLGVGKTERPARPAAEKPKLADVRDLRPAPEAAPPEAAPAAAAPQAARQKPPRQKPPRQKPPRQKPPRQKPLRQKPPRQKPPRQKPPRPAPAPPAPAPPAPAPAGPAPAAPGGPPLADFDTMTVASLRGRLRTLDLPTLIQLRGWESRHGARAGILSMLDHRINKLSAEATGSH